jgi:hypothetical protein
MAQTDARRHSLSGNRAGVGLPAGPLLVKPGIMKLRPSLVLLSLAAPANAQSVFGDALGDAIKNAMVWDVPDYFKCNKNLLATANATGNNIHARKPSFTCISHAWLH